MLERKDDERRRREKMILNVMDMFFLFASELRINESLIFLLACSAYNLISVGLYDTLGPEAVTYGINHSESSVVVTSGTGKLFLGRYHVLLRARGARRLNFSLCTLCCK